jgi:hypothetical protein
MFLPCQKLFPPLSQNINLIALLLSPSRIEDRMPNKKRKRAQYIDEHKQRRVSPSAPQSDEGVTPDWIGQLFREERSRTQRQFAELRAEISVHLVRSERRAPGPEQDPPPPGDPENACPGPRPEAGHPLAEFLNDNFVQKPWLRARCGNVRSLYRSWASSRPAHKMWNHLDFARQMAEWFPREKSAKYRQYRGLGLSETASINESQTRQTTETRRSQAKVDIDDAIRDRSQATSANKGSDNATSIYLGDSGYESEQSGSSQEYSHPR